MSAAMCGHARC